MIAKHCSTRDLSRRLFVALTAFTVGVYLGAGDLSAQEFEVPEGFMDVFEPDVSTTGEWRYLRTIRPPDGPFSDLSAIHLREVMNDVDDPADWLKVRLRANVGDMGGVEALLNSPDSPFGDPAFDALSKVISELSKISTTAIAKAMTGIGFQDFMITPAALLRVSGNSSEWIYADGGQDIPYLDIS